MRKIKLYIAASSDGFISPSDGDLDWLVGYPVFSPEDHKKIMNSIDTVIMGGNTYRNMCIMDIVYPYKDKKVYVVTGDPVIKKEGINFITEDAIGNIVKLKNENGKDIWLTGGAGLISSLLEKKMIDEMIINIIPVYLEKGIPLFSKSAEESEWILTSEKESGNGNIQRIYILK